MFMTELTPVVQELTGYPIAFLGGFVSGLLRLNLGEDPVKSWLDQQTRTTTVASTSPMSNGKGNGPQQISID
jgi:hypothetical protein